MGLYNLPQFLTPATKLGQGNVFTPVCHSVQRGSATHHPPGRHPLGRHSPSCAVPAGIRSTSGRYASYWNAILSLLILVFYRAKITPNSNFRSAKSRLVHALSGFITQFYVRKNAIHKLSQITPLVHVFLEQKPYNFNVFSLCLSMGKHYLSRNTKSNRFFGTSQKELDFNKLTQSSITFKLSCYNTLHVSEENSFCFCQEVNKQLSSCKNIF